MFIIDIRNKRGDFMERIKLSETLEVSRIIYGFRRLSSWGLNQQETMHHIENLIDMGITTFDHADIYGNYTCEKLFGDALAMKPSIRQNVQIITKCGIKQLSNKFSERKINHYDTSYEHIMTSVNQSLSNMKTDYLDLLLIHRPNPFMDPIEVSEAFNYLYKSGKVLNFGVSNFKPSSFNMLQKFLKFPLVTNQIELSPLNLTNFDNGTVDLCQEYEIPPMAWSPLSGGLIFSSNDEIAINVCQKLEEIAKRYNIDTLDQVIYAWLLVHPSKILPILGTQNLDRINKAILALELKLTTEEWFEIYSAAKGHDVD